MSDCDSDESSGSDSDVPLRQKAASRRGSGASVTRSR